MSAGLVSQHQQSAFSTPINGAAGDATVVLGNDNATVSTYNAHDADPTIHVQSSTAAVFAATPAGTAGRKWMTNDAGGVYLYYDTGSAWVEANYQRVASTGAVVITSTSSPQLTVEYDSTHKATWSVTSGGALTINATSTITITPATTISGAVTHSSTTTLSGALTYGGVTLSNAVTGTGNMALSASPTFTGTITAAAANFSALVAVALGAGSGATFTIQKNSGPQMSFLGTSNALLGAIDVSNSTGTMTFYVAPGAVQTEFMHATSAGAVVFAGAVSGITTLALTTSLTITGTNQALTLGVNTGVSSAAYTLMRGSTAASAGQSWYHGINVFATDGSYEAINSSGTVGFKITPAGAASLTHGLTIGSGLTVSAGTTAVQALTATTGTFSSVITATSGSVIRAQRSGGLDTALYIYHDGTSGIVSSTFGATGAYTDLVFMTNDTARVTIAKNTGAATFVAGISCTTFTGTNAATITHTAMPLLVNFTAGTGSNTVIGIQRGSSFVMRLGADASDQATIWNNAGTTANLTWTDAGAFTVRSTVTASAFASTRGTGSALNSTATTFYTISSVGTYLVSLSLDVLGNIGTYIVVYGGGALSAAISSAITAGSGTVTVSSLDIQVTQSSGSTKAFTWNILKIA